MLNARFGFRVGVVLTVGLAAAPLVDGCGGSDQSLVVVALTADPGDTTLKTVDIDVDTVSKTFTLTAGLTTTPTSLGVYVPASVKGNVLVTATARHAAAGGCDGYRGSGRVTIDTVGSTRNVVVALDPTNLCGAAGMTGS